MLIGRTTLCVVDGASVALLQPRENGDVQVIVARVFYFVATDVVQRYKMKRTLPPTINVLSRCISTVSACGKPVVPYMILALISFATNKNRHNAKMFLKDVKFIPCKSFRDLITISFSLFQMAFPHCIMTFDSVYSYLTDLILYFSTDLKYQDIPLSLARQSFPSRIFSCRNQYVATVGSSLFPVFSPMHLHYRRGNNRFLVGLLPCLQECHLL